MVTSLVHHERIQTTVPKAKELRKVADRIIRFGKEGLEKDFYFFLCCSVELAIFYYPLGYLDNLRNRIEARKVLRDNKSIEKLFQELGPRYR